MVQAAGSPAPAAKEQSQANRPRRPQNGDGVCQPQSALRTSSYGTSICSRSVASSRSNAATVFSMAVASNSRLSKTRSMFCNSGRSDSIVL